MGYYVTLTESQFSIPETPEVLAALHEMETKFDDIKGGGSFGPEGKSERWFSWMPDIRTLNSVREVFERLGFEVEEDGGKITLWGYDSKTGQEALFLAVVAPFVGEESYTQWRGEEGEVWRYVVHNGRLHMVEAEIKWGEPTPYAEVSYHSVGSFADGSYGIYTAVTDPYASAEDIRANIEQARATAKSVGA